MADLEKLLSTDSKVEALQKINAIIENGTGGVLNMFDTVLKDHILSFEESKGLALQGTYVYKDAIAGSRYGYSTFYEKCVEEKEAATATETTLGDNTITMYINANGHQFYDIADKEAVDAWYSTYGRAWFYGVDTENERIFLPRNSKYFRIGDETTVGTNQDAGLPTHTHTRGTMNITGQFGVATDGASSGWNKVVSNGGAFYRVDGIGDYSNGTSASTNGGFGFDASRSWTGSTSAPDNDIYGKSNTVELDSVNMLLYICVGNTESEEALTNVTEITTTENDTLPLLHHIPADEILEHPSWLRSAGQWNDGNVYATAYNYLVNEYMYGAEHTDTLSTPDGTAYTVSYKTIKGKKVVDVANVSQVDAVYSAIGSAWYYVINQQDMTFRLPMSHNSECYTSDPTRVGLDVSAGLPNIEGAFVDLATTSTSTMGVAAGAFKTGCSYEIGGGVYKPKETTQVAASGDGITLDASLSNPIYGNSDTVTPPHTEFYLYFKVANAVQNLELLNAGEVLEAVNDINAKVDNTVRVVETYQNGASWYRVYSDGWCEQGGQVTVDNGQTGLDVTLLKPYVDLNYNTQATPNSIAYSRYGCLAKNVTTSTIKITYNLTSGLDVAWQTKGYIL